MVHGIAGNEELAREWWSVERLMSREDVRAWAAWWGGFGGRVGEVGFAEKYVILGDVKFVTLIPHL